MTEQAKPKSCKTAQQFQALKPDQMTYWMNDSLTAGLRMRVTPKGTKTWLFNYRFEGKQCSITLGQFPAMTLQQARTKVGKCREQMVEGIDPARHKQQSKQQRAVARDNTFRSVAELWFEQTKATKSLNAKGSNKHWSESHARTVWVRIEKYLMPTLGKMLITEITPIVALDTLHLAVTSGHLDVVSRLYRDLWNILNFAKFRGLVEFNAAEGADQHLPQQQTKHHSTIKAEEIGGLLDELDTYTTRGQGRGNPLTALALKLLMHTFVRSSELRGAEWSEFDLRTALWTIPANRMKKHREHTVPLSRQTIRLIVEIKELSGRSKYLFPTHAAAGFMSDATLAKALRTLGYDGRTAGKSRAVPHGLRALAATILTEAVEVVNNNGTPDQLFTPDVIETALAHAQDDRLKKAYIRSPQHLAKRHHMMQWWSDYLDASQGKTPIDTSNVTPITKTKSA